MTSGAKAVLRCAAAWPALVLLVLGAVSASALESAAAPRIYLPPGVMPADMGFGDFILKFWMPLVDLEQRDRYALANAALAPPDRRRPRVVFVGDSITDGWTDLESVPFGTLNAEVLNRGISGQVSAQMLLRLQEDALDLDPRVLVLLAGTNDIRVGTNWNTAPTARQLHRLCANLATMIDAARGRGVKVILGTLPPVHDETFDTAQFPVPSTVLRPPETILRVNEAIRQLAATRGVALVDYHAALVDAHGRLRRDASDDGLHPNAEGYRLMRAALEPVLAKVLAARTPR